MQEAVAARVDELCGDRPFAEAELLQHKVDEHVSNFEQRAALEVVEESRKKLKAAWQWAQFKGDEGLSWQLTAEDLEKERRDERALWQALCEQRATAHLTLQIKNLRLQQENRWLQAQKAG